MLMELILPVPGIEGCVAHRSVELLDVVIVKAKPVGQSDHGNGVVTNHAPGLITAKRPDREGRAG